MLTLQLIINHKRKILFCQCFCDFIFLYSANLFNIEMKKNVIEALWDVAQDCSIFSAVAWIISQVLLSI